ncbi:hypothetical protein CIB48_g8994 [Xylaria polymorpha]|nr:hypothetical protein CIB48_g8994 [Xylaria polymorpha]
MSRSYVQDWINSLGLEPDAKRQRLQKDSDNIDLSYPYDAPYTPSLTTSNIDDSKRVRGGKRTADAFTENVDVEAAAQPANDTPNLPPIFPPLPVKELEERPPKRRSRSTSPIKGRLDLQKLEKPVRIDGLEDDESDTLPADIQTLYTRLRLISEPHHQPLDHHGLGSDPPPSMGSNDAVKTVAADALLSRIRRIRHQAISSTKFQRHECGWNNRVHMPLLELAFESESESESEPDSVSVSEEQCSWKASIRVEPAMFATISRESIPRLGKLFTGSDAGSVLAWSASEESINTGQSTSQPDPTPTRPNSDSKKVDYVVVVDVVKDAPLKKIILELILSVWDGALAHVNQTAYQAVSESLIAVSIETETISSSRDPLLQLAIWVAAWHQRMGQLRTIRLRHAMRVNDPKQPKLVSVPLIVATGHDWDIYFACDEGSSITLRGPLRIGSTATDLQLHILLCSLKAVKSWIKKTFYRSMCDWFMCSVDRVEGTELGRPGTAGV